MPDDEKLRLERKLSRALSRAIADFHMIADGDRIMVAVSGGKDSYTLLHLLAALRERAPVRFSLVAVHVDQGQPGYDGEPLREWLRERGQEHHVVREDTYSIVVDKVPEGKTYCSLCSRLRRGILYRLAGELGCTKIALGHHRDDAVVTLLLNAFFAGQLKAMPPKLVSDDGRNVVIRPLVYCAESDIASYAALERFPILPCNLCGSQENLQRKVIARMLGELEREHPDVRANVLAALGNVRPSHLLDARLWQRLALDVAREDEGEIAASRLVRDLA
jgi:tRNA 2-thiocytidine biosynthesis protein TtcA